MQPARALGALALVLLASGCGGEERGLSSDLAERLAARSDAVAALLDRGDPCGARSEAQRLQTDAIAAANAGRIPPALQEELLAAATELVEAIECPSSLGGTGSVEARNLSSWLRERG